MRKHRSLHGGRHVQLLEPRYLFAAGDVDTTFQNNGRVDNVIPGDVSNVVNTVFLPDGKILMGGYSIFALLAEQDRYFFRRFNADGSLDTTFGNGGTVTGNFTSDPEDDSHIEAFTVDANGKIWIVGDSTLDFTPRHLIARLNADGTPDPSFGGGDGNVFISGDRNFRIDVTADSKALVLGGVQDDTVRRFLADGSPDASFGGGDGIVQSPLDGFTNVLQPQPDGKVLLGGFTSTNPMHIAIARLNADGTPDTSFSGDGMDIPVVPGSGTSSNSPADIALLPGNKILIVGGTLENEPQSGGMVAVRYNANGTIDTTYGNGDGSVIVPFGGNGQAEQIVIDADGNTILLGSGTADIAIARLTPAGVLDESFGRVVMSGMTTPDAVADQFGGVDARFTGAGLDATGKLIVAGQRRLITPDDPSERHNFSFLVRYLTEDDGVRSPVTLDGAQHVMSVTGTAGADFMVATEVGDTVHAFRGGSGRAFGTADVQRIALSGGDGNDFISTTGLRTVPASVVGGLGADKIAGGEAGDTLEGSGGNDSIDGSGGADLLIGGNGNDALRGLGGDDTLAGGGGDDELRGGAGNDTYESTPGNDTVVDLDIEGVTLAGGVLKFYDADNSDDQVSFIPLGNGKLQIYVNGQTNTVDLNLVQRIEVNPTGGDDFVRVYQGLNIPALLYGGEGGETSRGGNDTLIGGAANDSLFGLDGDDVIFGNGGNDYINGFFGSDIMHGNAGRDTVDYSVYDGRLFISLDDVQDDGFIGENDLVFSDIEKVIGGSGPDRIGGSSADNILYGGAGDDTLGGGGGNDALYGAEGSDKLDGGDGDDYLEAGAGHDLLFGGAGADQLFALAGNDTLLSDDGFKDIVRGGTGTDTGGIDGLDDVLTVEVLS
jgi:uncharacterized delta-60 repeat protein